MTARFLGVWLGPAVALAGSLAEPSIEGFSSPETSALEDALRAEASAMTSEGRFVPLIRRTGETVFASLRFEDGERRGAASGVCRGCGVDEVSALARKLLRAAAEQAGALAAAPPTMKELPALDPAPPPEPTALDPATLVSLAAQPAARREGSGGLAFVAGTGITSLSLALSFLLQDATLGASTLLLLASPTLVGLSTCFLVHERGGCGLVVAGSYLGFLATGALAAIAGEFLCADGSVACNIIAFSILSTGTPLGALALSEPESDRRRIELLHPPPGAGGLVVRLPVVAFEF